MSRLSGQFVAVFLVLSAAGCNSQPPSSGNPTDRPVVGLTTDFPLGQNSIPSKIGSPALYPTAETPGAINHLASLTPVVASAAPSVGCASCGGMTMTVAGASYPGYGPTFNGNYNFVRIGTDPKGCQFEAQSTGTWRWLLRPSGFGGWELIGQQHSGWMALYHTSTDPTNGGTGWTGTSFQLVYLYSGESVPQSLTVN
jgi:hypothetical protein